MSEIPPTSPQRVPSAPPKREWYANTILAGLAIHIGLVLATCGIMPLALGSNIWPIAAVFWAVLTVPVAALTGLVSGLLVRRQPQQTALFVLAFLGIALAFIVGIIIARTP